MLRAPTDAVLKTWRLRFSANCLRSRVRGRSRASVERRREDCDSPRKSTSACGRSAPPSSAGSTAPTTSASQRTSPCARRRRRLLGRRYAVIIEKLSCASRILVTCCIIGCIAEFCTGVSSASRLGHKRGHKSRMPLNYMHALRRYTPCAGGWQNYITRQLDRHERHVLRAVAQVVVDEERQREALERRCAALETEIAEFDQERSPRLRAVPTAPALIA